jgi:serine/threonine protein kinase
VIAAVIVLRRRRKHGKDFGIELQLRPQYSSDNKKIRLLSIINSGGFGVVWKAKYEGETVAIKLIRVDKYENEEYDQERNLKTFRMVVDEASVMELMVHERIVRFIMFEIESIGIVLEYLPLGSLYDYIGKGKGDMPWKDRYQIMRDVYEGMEFLHSNVYADGSIKQVLFHQDLKSANVLLSMEENALRGKISDFGLSCKFLIIFNLPVLKEGPAAESSVNSGNSDQMTSVKVDVKGGTRCYQAPELFKRKAKFSRKADVYASGVIFLELLTLDGPGELYDDWWPLILELKILPKVLLKCLEGSLDDDPSMRIHFEELVVLITTGRDSILELKTFVLGDESIRAVGIAEQSSSSFYDSDVYSGSRLA